MLYNQLEMGELSDVWLLAFWVTESPFSLFTICLSSWTHGMMAHPHTTFRQKTKGRNKSAANKDGNNSLIAENKTATGMWCFTLIWSATDAKLFRSNSNNNKKRLLYPHFGVSRGLGSSIFVRSRGPNPHDEVNSSRCWFERRRRDDDDACWWMRRVERNSQMILRPSSHLLFEWWLYSFCVLSVQKAGGRPGGRSRTWRTALLTSQLSGRKKRRKSHGLT